MSFGSMHVPPKEHRERKPFQAFCRANDLRKKNALDDDAETRVGNPWGDVNKQNWISTTGGIMAICLLLAGIYYVWKGYSKLPEYEAKKAAAMNRTQSIKTKEDYNFLLKSGSEYLYFNNLSSAKSAFESAIKIYPDGLEAPYGLAKVLEKYCENENRFCTEAQEWKKFMDKQHPK